MGHFLFNRIRDGERGTENTAAGSSGYWFVFSSEATRFRLGVVYLLDLHNKHVMGIS